MTTSPSRLRRLGAGTAAALVAATLLAGSVVLSRVQGEPEAAVAVSWTASLYAVVAGLLLAADGGFGPSAVGAGLGAVLVGALSLLAVGEGRREVTWPAEVLGATSRSPEVTVAHAHGLTLEEVGYPDDDELAARAEQTRARRPPLDGADADTTQEGEG